MVKITFMDQQGNITEVEAEAHDLSTGLAADALEAGFMIIGSQPI